MDDRYLAALAEAAYSAAPTWAAGDVCAVQTGIVVAFRGTRIDSAEDWARDLDLVPAYYGPLGWCHRGFLDGAKAVWPQIAPHVDGNTILVGHSLGGALAIGTGGLAAAAGRPPAAIVTFGAPRVGLGTLVALLSGVPVRQYRHASDIVPEVPPGYRHVRLPLIEVGEADAPRPGIGDYCVLIREIEDHACRDYVADSPGDGT